ncbi:unnamed protein product [Parascedosporium putredinis]|uniref:DUF726-domain-containing protein n=1 Tax=Parascedosporium putredinis TaxID=1442378 RepID=A0A9P1MDA1_9PEZI|nr:unnamed protein product [Parascedosporium putredinis]CAI8002177.1 unnamed protein product [Parascedosporium putredinis]
MPPSATEPRQLVVVLNPARRKALYQLSGDIITQMRAQLELKDGDDDELDEEETDGWSDDDTLYDGEPGSQSNRGPPRQANPNPFPSRKLIALRAEAVAFLNRWANDFMRNLKEIVLEREDPKILDERKKRLQRLQNEPEPSFQGDDLIAFDGESDTASGRRSGIATLESIIFGTRAGLYALPDVLAKTPLSVLLDEETEIAKSLVAASAQAEQTPHMSAEAEAEKRRQEGQAGRFWKVGLASVAGAAVIGITGGLAAPVVAGAIGGLMGSGEMMDNYAKEVEDFRFIPLYETSRTRRERDNQSRRLRVTIGINGWLTDKDDITKPWSGLGDDSEVFALRYEMDKLLTLGKSLENMVSSYAWKTVKMEILRRTVLASLWAALWPAYVLSVAAKIDNPFNLALNRSEKAGLVLADALINRVQGERPVTLVGYSLGSRAIYTCLRTLAERRAFGLVDTVLRSVVAGGIFNVYTSNDYILGFLYRAHSLQLGVAGLQPIQNIKGVRNVDLSGEVSGHLRYPDLVSQILVRPAVRAPSRPISNDADFDPLSGAPVQRLGDRLPIRESRAPQRQVSMSNPARTHSPTPESPPLRVIEPRNESGPPNPPASAPVAGTTSRPELPRNPLSDSYLSTLETYDDMSDGDGGGITMVSYDSS